MHWYFDVLGKYAEFSGRGRRQEYWMFFLFNFIFAFVIGFIGGILASVTGSSSIGTGISGL